MKLQNLASKFICPGSVIEKLSRNFKVPNTEKSEYYTFV